MTLVPSAEAARAARAGKSPGHWVASNEKACSGRCATVIVSPSSMTDAPASHNGCVGLSGEYREVADRHFARDGPRYQQEGGRAPVALDFELRRPVALSSGHVEFFIVFMQDFDAEALGRVDRDVDIGGRYYVGNVNRRLLFGDRQGQQQSCDELGGNQPLYLNLAAPDRALDMEGKMVVAVVNPDAQCPERADHRPERAVQQRSFAHHSDRRVAEGCDRGEEPGGKPRLADVEFVACGGEAAVDFERALSGAPYPGTERLDAADG